MNPVTTIRTLPVESMEQVSLLFGNMDENIQLIQNELGVTIRHDAQQITIEGPEDAAGVAAQVLDKLCGLIRRGEGIDRTRIRYAIGLAEDGKAEMIDELMADVVAITYKGKQIRAKTVGQRKYVNAIKKNTVVFGVGPAGTGKTYLAMAMACMALKNKEVSRIVLTRPAVEAGEKLGFLPGDLQHKVDPYLRPLYDALYDILGMEAYQKLAERGAVEVAPLAYMRGRTLHESFIILDEAQNTTSEQMKMFLTRFGFGSRVVVTGDVTQVDLPGGKKSGLVEAVDVMRNIDDIETVLLTHRDVVRHELVQAIIKAYDRHDKRREAQR